MSEGSRRQFRFPEKVLKSIIPVTPIIPESRIHEMRNRVCVKCKHGSVSGQGGQPPCSTRPPKPPFPMPFFE